MAQLNASGTALVYSTIVGGGGDDYARAIALDGSGQITIAGHTSPWGGAAFPVTADAYRSSPPAGADVFVTRLNAAGTALVYSSRLGGSGDDFGYALALDGQSNAYVSGLTASNDFPTTPGAFRTRRATGFAAKLNAAGTGLVYSTYIGGDGASSLCPDVPAGRPCGGGFGIAVDAWGRAHVAGGLTAALFATPDALQYANAGGSDVFVARLDAAGHVYVAGTTASPDWPARDAYAVAYNSNTDAFVAAIDMSAGSCSYALPEAGRSAGAGGGTGSFSVTTQPGCSWMAVVPDAYTDFWVSVTSSAVATGGGAVSYSVAANNVASPRMGRIVAGRRTFTITQAAAVCTYALSALSTSVGNGGGTGAFTVTCPANCPWTASSSAAWVTAVVNGSTVSYSVTANSGAERTATITVAGQMFTITQAAAACTYSLSATAASVGSEGGTGSFSVIAPAHCSWTASSPAAWITVAISGSTVTYTVAAHFGVARSGAIPVAGRTFTITQTALVCGYRLPVTYTSIAAAGGVGSFSVEAPRGCLWNASATATWVTITEGAAGNGSGMVRFGVAANADAPRMAVVTVAGVRFTIAQTGQDRTPPFGSLDIPLDKWGMQILTNCCPIRMDSQATGMERTVCM